MKDYPKLDIEFQRVDWREVNRIEREAERIRAEFIAGGVRALGRSISSLFGSGKSATEAGSAA